MSTAKQLIIDNLSDISDDNQDEFEDMENLYKLLRFKKSQQSITEYGGHTTDEVRKMFQKKYLYPMVLFPKYGTYSLYDLSENPI